MDNDSPSVCLANQPCYSLPPANREGCEDNSSSMNGGKVHFTAQEFEVYRVFVNIIKIIYFIGNMRASSKGIPEKENAGKRIREIKPEMGPSPHKHHTGRESDA